MRWNSCKVLERPSALEANGVVRLEYPLGICMPHVVELVHTIRNFWFFEKTSLQEHEGFKFLCLCHQMAMAVCVEERFPWDLEYPLQL